ncbi:16S rRNA (uracil(1498)-N(3))-methyltransferase [uncultured Jatrophihabitans sp.]|uniref:16S rRNA (uracil(1498)-N(3))-methyltransferase n=1 Tax=uncultured Jatrophihabitans sp. TaxID=1610747 RepID=UPI0035CB6892
MTPPLFLVDSLPDTGTFLLGGDEGRHAARVRRLTVGESVLVSDGLGGLLECVVAAVVPDGLQLTVRSVSTVPVPRPRLVVVQALPKGDRAELAVEVLTELGVDEIVPWSASRSITRWDGPRGAKAIEKWRRTAREAAKQSRRPRLPIVHDLASTTQVASRLASGFVLHEDATVGLSAVPLPDADEIVLVVGPEGGVSPEELDAFVAAGAVPVRLGVEVMRTSTAGAAALAVVSVRVGRWG